MRKIEEYNIPVNNDEDGVKVKKPAVKKKLTVFEVFEAMVAAVIVVAIIFMFCFRIFNVEGPSMKPTLQPGDKIIVSNIGYKPQRGDVVVISGVDTESETLVKRIIAVGGDEVDINFTTGVVTVNGLEERYADCLTNQQFDVAFPITVPEGHVFVLGDNRGFSVDSRKKSVGCVDERKIVGKVVGRIFPIGSWEVK